MRIQSVFWLTLTCLIASCGMTKKAERPSDPTDAANAARCEALDNPPGPTVIASPVYCPYPALQPNEIANICNSQNVTATIDGGCGTSPARTGSWQPASAGGLRLHGEFACEGVFPSDINGWKCTTQTVTVSFADGANQTFTSTEAQEEAPNTYLEPMRLLQCGTPTFYSILPASEGNRAFLTVTVPAPVFTVGQHEVRDTAKAPQDASQLVDVEIGLYYYSPGEVAGGLVDFTSVSLDPNKPLTFTLDANLRPPSSDVQQGDFAVYCGNPNELHSGHWLTFITP